MAENIARLGAVDPAQVVLAAQRARAHQMILSLPQGYDTMIDPHSAVVSPGQRQRIALARALYGDPKLVILDEPNSNLDAEGEQALAETLAALRGQATVIVVTHRTNLIQHVDKMLVLESGKVQRQGDTAEVMRSLQPKGQPAPQTAAAPMVMPMRRSYADAAQGAYILREGSAS